LTLAKFKGKQVGFGYRIQLQANNLPQILSAFIIVAFKEPASLYALSTNFWGIRQENLPSLGAL